MPDLLIELFSEEIPARMQARAAENLQKMMTNGMVEAGLTYEGAAAFATPRRLALTVHGLTANSPTVAEERKGPRTDAPEKALEGFLRSTGLTKDQLEVRDDKKGQVYFAKTTKEGRPAEVIVAEVLEATIRNFPWPKSMRWGAGTLRWVRPLHSIIAILSDEAGTNVVPLTVDGITAGDRTKGHRFMAPDEFAVSGFEDYETKLAKAHVVLRADARAEAIRADAQQAAFASGVELVADESLLAEVAGLVEWPVVLMGDIGEAFLDLPAEVLQTSMKEHQKFFSLRNPQKGRIEKYITVANRETKDRGATILAGNSRVLAARLADAKFFWENDLRVAKAGMGPWLEGLASVTFHNKLGSQADRIARIAALARTLAEVTGADADEAEEAARLAKADLNSEMVYEFPELQGVMGRYYALEAGKSAAVADAARDHYAPLGPSDDVPTAPVSVTVSLADKIDMLTSFWKIDEKPTGSKDPFALRRAALGVIRIVLENDLKLGLLATFEALCPPETAADLLKFTDERLKGYLRDEGTRHDVIEAAKGMAKADYPQLLVRNARALQAFLGTEDGENFVQGVKRAANILGAEEKKDGVSYELDADPKLAQSDEEKALFAALDAAEPAVNEAIASENYEAAMVAMAKLRGPIDSFFEDTLINADNAMLRRNRLCLLNRIRQVSAKIADVTALEG